MATLDPNPSGGPHFASLSTADLGLRRKELGTVLEGISDAAKVADVAIEYFESLTAENISIPYSNHLRSIAEAARGAGQKVLVPFLEGAIAQSKTVKDSFVADYWENVVVPTAKLFMDDDKSYRQALEAITEAANKKYLDFTRRGIIGGFDAKQSYNYPGVRNLVEAIPQMSGKLEVFLTLVKAVSDLPHTQREVLATINGVKLMQELAKVPEPDRAAVFAELMDADKKASALGSLKAWDFLLVDGYRCLAQLNAVASAKRVNDFPQKAQEIFEDQITQRWGQEYAKGAAPQGKSVKVDIRVPPTDKELEQIIQEIRFCDGAVNILVHPLTALSYLDPVSQEFTASFRESTKREWNDYVAYRSAIELKLTEPSDSRCTFILCENHRIEETYKWLEGLGLSGSVVIVPTMRSYPTPITDDIHRFSDLVRSFFNEQFDTTKEVVVNENRSSPWDVFNETLRELGVRKVFAFGEYATAILGEGQPLVDGRGNLILTRPCCLESLFRHASADFIVRILGDSCFPSSTALAPIDSNPNEQELFESLVATLPSSTLQRAAKQICGDNYHAMHSLTKIYADTHMGAESRDTFTALFEQFTDANRNVRRIASFALVLYGSGELSQRNFISLSSTLSNLGALAQFCPDFALDRGTLRMVAECKDLEELEFLVSGSSNRIKILSGSFSDEKSRSICRRYISHLLSPAHFSDQDFIDEKGIVVDFFRLGEQGKVTARSDKSDYFVPHMLQYFFELRLLVREGVISGDTLYLDSGPDALPYLALMKEMGKDQDWRFIWLSASEFEIRAVQTLLDALNLRSSPLNRSPSPFPVSRDLRPDVIFEYGPGAGTDSSKIAERFSRGYGVGINASLPPVADTGDLTDRMKDPVSQYLGHKSWRYETRGLNYGEHFVALPGHSSDPTPVKEYLGGTRPNCIILKGVETWAFRPILSGSSYEGKADLPKLYQYLDRIASLTDAGTRVIVSMTDVHCARYFREHPMFDEVTLGRDMFELEQELLSTQPTIDVKFNTGDGERGGFKLTDPTPDLPSLNLSTIGCFRVFRRKEAGNTRPCLIERCNLAVTNGRHEVNGSGGYKIESSSILQFLPPNIVTNINNSWCWYLREEILKTERVLNQRVQQIRQLRERSRDVLSDQLSNFRTYLEDPTKDHQATLKAALNDYPRLWIRYRNLIRNQTDPQAPEHKEEEAAFGVLILLQLWAQKAFYGEKGWSVPPGVPLVDVTHAYTPPPPAISAIPKDPRWLNPPYDHGNLRDLALSRTGWNLEMFIDPNER